jgi:signal transduction histidine kinase
MPKSELGPPGSHREAAQDRRTMIEKRRVTTQFGSLLAILGPAGLLFGLFSLLAIIFGLVVLAREYDRLRQTSREALRPVVAGWVRTVPVHDLGWTLVDYADRWRRAPSAERAGRLDELRIALRRLGDELNRHGRRAPLIEIVSLDLSTRGGPVLASWRPKSDHPIDPDLADRIPLLPASSSGPAIDLAVQYHAAPEIERAAAGLETPYHRLLVALLGLSIYPLLCLIYMVMQARVLRDRAAREAAQAATLDLADRTCHELGNVAFVLSNERRNLADHLDLVDRFVAEEQDAIATAAARAGLTPAQAERLKTALRREYADRGIDPAVELEAGASVARVVCGQIAVCADYMALTVRELDSYLKQSSLPVCTEPINVVACLDDAVALLTPRLEAASIHLEHPSTGAVSALGDRRLLVHALVNLLKNAIEAIATSVPAPCIRLSIEEDHDTVWIEVADNGPGIPADLQPRLFEVGYSTKGAGRGRGLNVVRDSIAAQRARITLESTPETGTRFRIGLRRAGAGSVTHESH